MGEKFFAIDWHAIFVPEHSLLEMVVPTPSPRRDRDD
jgi:hypothetical protein